MGLLVFLVGLRQFDFKRGDIFLALDFDDLLFVVAFGVALDEPTSRSRFARRSGPAPRRQGSANASG